MGWRHQVTFCRAVWVERGMASKGIITGGSACIVDGSSQNGGKRQLHYTAFRLSFSTYVVSTEWTKRGWHENCMQKLEVEEL